MLRFGKKHGHQLDYGHCDLVWAKSAPREIFPEVIRWLDERQPSLASAQGGSFRLVASPHPTAQGVRSGDEEAELPIRIVVGDKNVRVR
jgi:hypothetical protein